MGKASVNKDAKDTPPVGASMCIVQNNIPKMAATKRHAYGAQFKLQAISEEDHWNQAAAGEFKIHSYMVLDGFVL